MNNAKAIRTIVGIIGTIIYSLISLSQIPSFIKIYKKKSVEDDDEPPVHLSMIMECSLWFLFGLPFIQKDHILVTITYTVGFLIEVIYFVLFFIYCGRDKIFIYYGDELQREHIRRSLVAKCVFVAIIFGLTCVIKIDGHKELYLGLCCITFTGITLVHKSDYVSPAGMSLSFASFVNAGIWIAYSLIYNIDYYLLASNGVGALFYAGRLVVNACKYKSQATVVPVILQPPNEQILQV